MSELDKDILEEYAKHNSLFKTASKLDVTAEYVHSVVEGAKVEEEPDTSSCKYEGYGDPEKRKFLVARKTAEGYWDNEIPEVAQARERYEAGTHDMATGRDGPYLLLYSFPRPVVSPRPNDFTPTVGG